MAFALGLALLVGSLGELPHGHAAPETAIQPSLALTGAHPATATALKDDATCPVCVLQRLLRQAQATGVTALERPGATGVVVVSPALRAGVGAVCSGSPRGPPPTV